VGWPRETNPIVSGNDFDGAARVVKPRHLPFEGKLASLGPGLGTASGTTRNLGPSAPGDTFLMTSENTNRSDIDRPSDAMHRNDIFPPGLGTVVVRKNIGHQSGRRDASDLPAGCTDHDENSGTLRITAMDCHWLPFVRLQPACPVEPNPPGLGVRSDELVRSERSVRSCRGRPTSLVLPPWRGLNGTARNKAMASCNDFDGKPRSSNVRQSVGARRANRTHGTLARY
jgi:hypothetical protein